MCEIFFKKPIINKPIHKEEYYALNTTHICILICILNSRHSCQIHDNFVAYHHHHLQK